MRAPRLIAICALALSMARGFARAQDSGSPTLDTSEQEAGDEDDARPRRRLVKWNEYEGPISTVRLGFGLLVDFSGYTQDEESQQQFDLHNSAGLRDARLLFRGRFQTERPLSWCIGYMYDSVDGGWLFRQTGIQIGFPEVDGELFIGRTKEGYSMIKVMTGYHPWTMERSPGLDAFVPILADGVKWMGWLPTQRVFFSVGAFADTISEGQKFASYDFQAATRIGWLPIASEKEKTVWHVAAMGRGGRPDEGNIRLRSRPEDSLAPYFVDTGTIASDRAGTAGVETYYRRGSWLVGGEFDWQNVGVHQGTDLAFFAGDAVVTWIMTGETREYYARGGYFLPISPDRTIFEGGTGAWEAVLHVSYIDLDDRAIEGGQLFRMTSMVNWYLSDNIRLEFSYAFGVLDRFGLSGNTSFFQSRVQFTL